MKQKLKNLFAILIGVFIGIAFGVFITETYFDILTTLDIHKNPLLALTTAISPILSIVLMIFLQIIIHEFGHLVGGLLSGYRYYSFRVGNLVIQKNNNKLKLKKFKIAGTLGQCIMFIPNKDFKDIPYFLYHFMGGALNLILSLIAFIISLFNNNPLVIYNIYLFIFFGVIMGLQNLIPSKMGGINNDGMNILQMHKSDEAKINCLKCLKINELFTTGTQLKDIDLNLFTVTDGRQKKDALSASIYSNYIDRLLEEKKYEECYSKSFEFLKDNLAIISIHKNQMIAIQIFCLIMLKKEKEEIENLITKDYKKMALAMKNFPSFIRTTYALAIYNNDEKEMQKQKKLFNKILKTYPNQTEITIESMHMNDVLNLYSPINLL